MAHNNHQPLQIYHNNAPTQTINKSAVHNTYTRSSSKHRSAQLVLRSHKTLTCERSDGSAVALGLGCISYVPQLQGVVSGCTDDLVAAHPAHIGHRLGVASNDSQRS
jgi:hypothetical protein